MADLVRSAKLEMKTIFVLLIALIVTGSGLGADADRVSAVDAADKKMNAAIDAARKSLPHFWSKLEKPGHDESDFNLKVRIEDKNGAEHFWCADVRREPGKMSGVINNDPMTVKSVSNGQRVFFTEDQISDWLYLRNGKMIGNYTVRPLMRDMSKEERREIESMLGPLP